MTELFPDDVTILKVEGRWRNGGKSVGDYVELDADYQPELLDAKQLPDLISEDAIAMAEYPSDITYDYRITYSYTNNVVETIEVDVRTYG